MWPKDRANRTNVGHDTPGVPGIANSLGITLVELVVVMAVLSVLASIAMPLVRISVKREKEMELRRDLREMRDAIDYYKRLSDQGAIPKQAGSTGYPKTLDTLVQPLQITPVVPIPGQQQQQLPPKIRFLRKIPVDPMTGKNEWGMRSNEDDPDSTTWGGQDVFDVYSQSDGIALDGTNYKDW